MTSKRIWPILAVLAIVSACVGPAHAQRTYSSWGTEGMATQTSRDIKPAATTGVGALSKGQDNAAVGGDAGRLIASGEENLDPRDSVYIGARSKALAANPRNEIVIGADAVGAGSHTVTIGNASTTATYIKGTVYSDGDAALAAHTASTSTAVHGLGTISVENVPLVVGKGGTGATSSATARTNLDVYSKAETNATVTAAIATVAAAIPDNASFTLGGLSTKAFSELTGIPTTIPGYGLTDAASITALTDHTTANAAHDCTVIASAAYVDAAIDADVATVAADLAGHVASTGANVHGLGTLSTQNANAAAITGGSWSGGQVQGASQVASATALAAHADATGLNVHGMNATGTASITVTLLNCLATGTLTIPLVAPADPQPGMIWFEP